MSRKEERDQVPTTQLKPEHMPGLHVEDVEYRIIPADRRHHRYVCDAMSKTLCQHDQTLSHEAAFLQTLVLVTARDWFTVVATPDGDEILGFCVYRMADTIAWLQTKTKYRGRGIGSALLGFPIADQGFDKHVATPFRSEQGWAWAARRGWTPHHKPNLVFRYMDRICKTMVIEELKGRLE